MLKDAGYVPIVNTSGLWKHKTRQTLFSLCVDDFGVKYYDKADVVHLKNAIEKAYTVKIDWEGKDFLGYTLDWNYKQGYVDLSMLEYVLQALEKLQHIL